ncbi:MAG: hypothetical protein MK171_03470 [Pirellulales bacterium]|nr:hypothetical protein [Pirellulales bacterium]
MSRYIRLVCFLLPPFFLTALAGCPNSSEVSPALLAEYQNRLLLDEEPDGAQVVVEVRETLLRTETAHDNDHHDADDHEHAHEKPDDHDVDQDQAVASDHDHGDRKVALPTETIEVVLVGQIGGLANPWEGTQAAFPFAKNEAKFFLADPGAVASAETTGHSHAPGEECAFCAAHAKDNAEMLAIVRFIDEKGTVLPIDAHKLFDVNEKDTVVVQGAARIAVGGELVVDATGIYVRR